MGWLSFLGEETTYIDFGNIEEVSLVLMRVLVEAAEIEGSIEDIDHKPPHNLVEQSHSISLS